MTDLFAAAADLLDPPDVDTFALLGYTPEPPQQAFHNAVEFDVGYGGLAGAGKSMALLMDAIRVCVTWPGMRAGIFRRSYDELDESILSKAIIYQDQLHDLFGARLIGAPRPVLRFANGSDLRFRYAESIGDATRRQGGEYQWIGIDERQQVMPNVPDYLMTRIRSGRPGVPVLGVRSTFNPGGLGHATLKERYIERTEQGTKVYVETHNNDGEALDDPISIRFVPGERSTHINASYWSRLQAVEDPVLRRQLAEGDWDAGGGLMFSETWRRNIHVITPEQYPVPLSAGVAKGMGIDYGISNPFCALWGAKLTDDLVVIYREVYKTGLTPDEQAKLILGSEAVEERAHGRHTPAWLDPSCWTPYPDQKTVAGAAPTRSIASDYQRAGVPVARAHNDRIGGVRLVHQALKVREDGMPRLLVYSTCPNLIKQLGGLPRDQRNPEDVDTRAEDHAFDALKYLLYGLVGKRNTEGRERRGTPPAVTSGLYSRGF